MPIAVYVQRLSYLNNAIPKLNKELYNFNMSFSGAYLWNKIQTETKQSPYVKHSHPIT